jgi:cell division transport system permease protein
MQRPNGTARPKQAMKGQSGGVGYFVGRAVTNIRQNLAVSFLAVGTITLSLLILALFLLVYVNLRGMADRWSSRVQVAVYFDNELALDEQLRLRQAILAVPGSARVTYVSKSEAFSRFRDRLAGQQSLLEGVTADVLPSSFEITLDRGFRDDDSLKVYVGRLKRITGITEIQYGEEWVRRFNTFLTFIRVVGFLLGLFLLVAVVFIVANTIRLTIIARQDELELMALVGATRFFIKAPFIIEGVLQGVAGAFMALLLLGVLYISFQVNADTFFSLDPTSSGLTFLSPSQLLLLLATGVLLGFIGSITSLRRFVNRAL